MLNLALADFGCSQFVDSHGHAVSSPGTPLFAAPEVMFHRNGLEADLWSAGVLVRRGKGLTGGALLGSQARAGLGRLTSPTSWGRGQHCLPGHAHPPHCSAALRCRCTT